MTAEERKAMVLRLVASAHAGKHDDAEVISLLIGALTWACGHSSDPVAATQIAIDSLSKARDICIGVLTGTKPERQVS